MATEIDDLVTDAVRHARWRTTTTRTMSALILALDSARAAVADRRHELGERRPEHNEKRNVRRVALREVD